MAIGGKKHSAGEFEENVFWTTMSDLMLGIAIVFMTLFVLAMTGFTQESIKLQENQMKATEELVEKLKDAEIDAEVDKLTGNVKISELQLFDLNSYTLKPEGKALLDKFVPIYLDTLYSKEDIANNITNIIIQGHTDSQSFVGLKTIDEQYAKNMELSLLRANAVAQYAIRTKYDRKNSERFRKMLVVEGKSFSEPVLVDGVEDYAKSRRVELKVRVKPRGFAKIFGLNYGNN
ncbi:OmpA family protein [bacterium]|nr:OmpA family protein [bacterium]